MYRDRFRDNNPGANHARHPARPVFLAALWLTMPQANDERRIHGFGLLA